MQRLRILSGQHAGATLDLTPGNHSIGPDHDCDISITDWTFPPLRVAVSRDGDVLAHWTEGRPPGASDTSAASVVGGVDPAAGSQRFVDFEPCAFGDVVLCVGPADKAWPSDRALLEAAFPPTAQRVAHWAGTRLRSRATSVIAGVSVLTLVAICSVALVGSPQAAHPVATIQSVVAQARQAAVRAGAAKLDVQAEQQTIVVSGMVETGQQAGAVRAAIDELHSTFAVAYRFGVAGEIAESLRSSVGLAGAEVKHLGDGVFSFTAEAADPQATRQAIDRVVADLGPLVRRVDVTLEQTDKKKPELPILSSMQDDEVSIVQTRDGQKHLVITDVEPGLTVRRALAIPQPAAPGARTDPTE
jgi:type III secretion protein D